MLEKYCTFFIITFGGGLLAVLFGLLLYFLPPKKINWIYGYRTIRSSKSQPAWDFAQKFSAKNLIIFGAFLFLSSSIDLFGLFNDASGSISGLVLFIICYTIPIVRTEYHLKQRFGGKDKGT